MSLAKITVEIEHRGNENRGGYYIGIQAKSSSDYANIYSSIVGGHSLFSTSLELDKTFLQFGRLCSKIQENIAKPLKILVNWNR